MADVAAAALIAVGSLFYLVGSIGLLRMPDLYCRLHALTKADNLGLGLLVAGLVLLADDLASALKLVLIWLLVLAASGVGAHLIARQARRGTGR